MNFGVLKVKYTPTLIIIIAKKSGRSGIILTVQLKMKPINGSSYPYI